MHKLFTMIALLAVAPMLAAGEPPSGIYFGAGLGAAEVEYQINPYCDEVFTEEEGNVAMRVFGGTDGIYLPSNNESLSRKVSLGAELGFASLGDVNDDTVHAVDLAAVLRFHVAEDWAVYGKAGNAWWEAGSEQGNDGTGGAGVEYRPGNLLVRLEFQKYKIDGQDADVGLVGIGYRF